MRRSRQEILDLFKACHAKSDETPGLRSFCKTAGLKPSEVTYYWPRHSALIEEAGAEKTEYTARLSDDVVFSDYARVCLHLGKVPTPLELRIATRELKTRTHTTYTRDGTMQAFQDKFRGWLRASNEKLRIILNYKGWARTRENPTIVSNKPSTEPHLHPFLPGCIQYLEVLARGEMPPFEPSGFSPSILFERRTADAFRCLGFEIEERGQGTGRNADCIACARRERVALIIDAKVRAKGYVLGVEDRKFLEYAVTHSKELQKTGFESIYLVVVGPSFRESDLKKLGDYVSPTPIRSVDMITARALMRIVEESIRERSEFSLADLTKELFGNKIIAA